MLAKQVGLKQAFPDYNEFVPYSQKEDYKLVPKFGVIKGPRKQFVNQLDLLPEVAEYME